MGRAQQSLSVAWVQPFGQQRSWTPSEQVVMGMWWQATLHWSGVPDSSSRVQVSPSSGQRVGQVAGGSQVSSAPTLPSLHMWAQSASVSGVQPRGQQLSPARQALMGWCVHFREQPSTVPLTRSTVHASASSHE